MNWSRLFFFLICFLFTLNLTTPAIGNSNDIGKWKRFEVSYPNSSFSGNPFDLEFYGLFTHSSSGRTLKQLGFYAGNNTWTIYFMPDQLGTWTFTTVSPDRDLDGKKGSFQCIPSNLAGRLMPDGRRWKLEDGRYDAPIMIPTREWFKRTKTADGIDDFIHWAKDAVGARIIGTTLVYFTHAQDEIPYSKGKEGDAFNIPMWDRLNSHFDAIRDAGMGHYIMFYSDDAESPNRWGIGAQSRREQRLLRYAMARLSAYPIVIWDTGIDISETRSQDWIDWFADWFIANDPWQHPVGSRSGGGSGGKHPKRGTYWSDGASELPEHSSFVSTWKSRSVPTAFTDRWREDDGRGNFTRETIRRSVWEISLVGGSAVYVSGNNHGGYLGSDYASDFSAAADCGYAARFFRHQLYDFGTLTPHSELVVSGTATLSANVQNEYVAYLRKGGEVTIDLRATSGSLEVRWYNPRTGSFQSAPAIDGGAFQTFSAPSRHDWVLHIRKARPFVRLTPPTLKLMTVK